MFKDSSNNKINKFKNSFYIFFNLFKFEYIF